MKKGIRAHDINSDGIESIIQTSKKMKFDCLQLVLEKSIDDFKFGKFSEEYATENNRKHGDVDIAVLGSYINPSLSGDKLQEEINKFKEKIKYASVLKPITVATETGVYAGGNDSEEAYVHILKVFKELAAEAERYNVSIGIEGVWCFVINTPQKMFRLINDLSSDKVNIVFDPVNYINIDNYKNQDEIINYAFDNFADKIAAIHAKDFTVENNEVKSAPICGGMLNWKLIVKNMIKYNADVPIIAEGYDEKNAKIGLDKIEKIQCELMKGE